MMRARSFACVGIVVLGSTLAACTSLLGDFDVSGDVGDGGTDGTTGAEGGADGGSDVAQQPDSPSDGGGGGGEAEAGCSGLVCNGICVPNDTKNCGTCGHDCTNLPHVSGTISCRSGGVCAFGTTSCAMGFADCNMMPDDGCEADLSKTSHCGTCSTVCSGATPVCTGTGDAGTMFSCASGCPVNMPTLCSGTCVDLNTNAQNCRTCGNACANVSNGQPGCAAGTCGIGLCNANFQDCNMVANDGCEVNTQTDPAHCGSCAGACNLPRATAGCAGGTCTIASCTAGFGDCNNMASDGCETNINTDSTHCGPSCTACTGGKTCQGGACLCPTGTTLCGATCVATQTDGNNCNACGRNCQGGTCSGGVCQPVIFVKASLISNVQDFATDGTSVVWSDNGDNTIDSVASLGAATKTVLAGSTIVSGSRAIAMSPDGNGNVQWAQYDGTSTRIGNAHAGVAGSGVINVTIGGVTNGLVFDPNGTTVYTTRTLSPTITLLSCPMGGACGGLTSVTSGQASFDLAFGGGFVVFGDVSNSSVIQYKLANGTSTTSTAQSTAYHVSADGTYAWWVQGSSQNTLNRANLGSSATMGISMAAGTPIASDGAYVYFVVATGISYIPVAGGAVVPFVNGANPGHIKLAAGALYYDGAGSVFRVKTP